MDAAFDLGGGFNPAKGLSVVVPVGEVAGDGPFQTADAVRAAAADGLTSNQGKPAFDQIEPRGAGASALARRAGCVWVHFPDPFSPTKKVTFEVILRSRPCDRAEILKRVSIAIDAVCRHF